ncbi:YVTN family beta-propeller repeat protein [Pseudomonas oryzae]|uniref:40-residue YVTN family beta-propeller repeat-containing protein n=1 Tax=Pseudomonas oryzae TaxID=1392877 RepID=A0A1H1ZJ99_9PSED|nr:YncE family protein [Pseudomonas oryzae]SDT33647.1 40-residue YVTN family beta-propeller repeat-containing protein [Pseudomonas oryzae]
MKPVLAAVGMALSMLASAASSAATIYAANEGAGSLTIIDDEARTTRTLALNILPHNVDMTPDRKTLLIVGMPGGNAKAGHGDHDAQSGRLLVFDADKSIQSARIIQVGGHPAHVVPDRSGKLAFVTDAASHAVVVVDLDAERILDRIKVGSYPHGLRLSPDGRTLAVANRDSNDISLIDVASSTQTARIAVGSKPVQVAFAPDGQRLFISLSGENAVAVVDLQGRRLIATYPVGPGPIQLSVTPDGTQLVVANQGSRQAPGHTLSILDAASGRLIATTKVGNGAHGVSIASDGSRAYVSNAFEDSVSVVDLKSHAELARFPTSAGPNGIVAR